MTDMHVGFVLPNLPGYGRDGGADRMAGLIDGLRARGLAVTIFSVSGKHRHQPLTDADYAVFRDKGVGVVPIAYQRSEQPGLSRRAPLRSLATLLTCPERAIMPNEWATRPLVHQAVREVRPDVVVAFSPDPLFYVQGLTDVPVLSIISETPHLNMAVTREYSPESLRRDGVPAALSGLFWRTLEFIQERVDARQLSTVDLPAFSAPHYVAWARSRGVCDPHLFKTSVRDTGTPGWRERRVPASEAGGRVKIVVIGHLGTTNNAAGLPLLFDGVLPELERRLGRDKFEIHIVGDDRMMPARFDALRSHPSVCFRGPVFPPDDEFLSTDIFLVTTPAPTGPRTRILTAYTFGCCVVAHGNNALGLPGLEHGANVLLGDDGPSLAEAIVLAVSDSELRRRLGNAGRELYEQAYTPDIATSNLIELLEATVIRHRRRHGQPDSRGIQ